MYSDSVWGYVHVQVENPGVGVSEWGHATTSVTDPGKPSLMVAGEEKEVIWRVMKDGASVPVLRWTIIQGSTEVPLKLRSIDWTPPPPEVAGAVSLGTANYTVPSTNAIFLSASGNDANPGTQASPKGTLIGALNAVPAGGTVVVRGGEYRQSQPNVITKTITVQNYPGEVVWFDGSDPLTGWTYDAGSGRWWASSTTEWDHSDPNGLAGAYNPLAVWPDMIFYDGQPLWLVSSNPTSGQFSVDYTNDRVWIADNPSGHELRITTRDRFLMLKGPNSAVRGIGIRRFTYPSWGGTLQINDTAVGTLVENVHMHDSAIMSVDSSSVTITKNTLLRPLSIGFGGNDGADCSWTHNIVDYANWKLITNHVPAAQKITRHARSRIAHNIFRHARRAMGIWLDESCYEPVIVGNLVEGIDGNGIFIELTEYGIIASNYLYGGGDAVNGGAIGTETKYGLCSYNSGSQRFWNNFVQDFKLYNVHLGGDVRRNSDPAQQVSGGGIHWSQMPWYVRDIEIVNNIIGDNKQYFQFGGEPVGIDMQSGISRVEGNLSYGDTGGGTSDDGLFRWYNGTSSIIYKTWSAINTARPGKGFANNALTGVKYPTRAHGAAIAPSIGIPLPADVATAIGAPVGYVAVGPLLLPPVPIS